jgi:hypothetical protein
MVGSLNPFPTRLCEIRGCFNTVAGCPEDDNCPAEHLCVVHYFQMKMLCEPEDFEDHGCPIKQPNEATRAKILSWYAARIAQNPR